MSKYRLLALDMDGTLLTDDHRISKKTAEAIRDAREAGITVILSTGRAFQNAVPYVEELGLDSPMVTVNGSEVWKKPHQIYIRHLLDREAVKHMVALSESHDTWFWAYSTKRLYNRDNWNADIDSEDWLKFGYTNEDKEVLGSLWQELRMMGDFELSNSSPDNIEINPSGIHKASGLRLVCDLIGCTMSEAVSIGDSLNDLAAIQASGLGIAMGNAQDEVKRAADAVVRSNNEDGIAQAIWEYVLK